MIFRWLRYYYRGFRGQMALNQPIWFALGAAARHASWWTKNAARVARENAEITARQQYWGA